MKRIPTQSASIFAGCLMAIGIIFILICVNPVHLWLNFF